MKKIYFLFFAVIFSGALAAQCTINTSVFNGPNDYSIHPDTIQNLPVATVGVGYNTDLQFHIKPDTTTSQGTFDIRYIKINSVTGLPANFSWIPNPADSIIHTTSDNGTGYGCVAVTGNPQQGQENGGPNNDGIYPVVVNYTAYVYIFVTLTPFPATQNGYKVHIVNPNGVANIDLHAFSVAQNSPNPADASTDFHVNSPANSLVHLTVYNMLGEQVKALAFETTKGVNRFSLNTAALASGMYVCSFRMGDAIVTRRITVSH